MKLNDAKAFVGHQVHVCRFREAGTLLRWMGDDLARQAGPRRRRRRRLLGRAGAQARRGRGLHRPRPRQDALRPAPSSTPGADRVRRASSCRSRAGPSTPCCRCAPSSTSTTAATRWIDVAHPQAGRRAVHVRGRAQPVRATGRSSARRTARSTTCSTPTRTRAWPGLLGDRDMELADYSYQFRSRTTERLYLSLSAYGGRVGSTPPRR